MRGILIPSGIDEDVEEVHFDGTSLRYLQQMNERVGGYIERVTSHQLHTLHRELLLPGRTLTMVVNEDGNALGLEENPRAGKFYDGLILGPAILVGEYDTYEGPDFGTLSPILTVDIVIERTR